jgi:glycogen synthase
MQTNNILVTSQSLYLDRFQYLFQAMEAQGLSLNYLPLVDVPIDRSYSEKFRRRWNIFIDKVLHGITGSTQFLPSSDPLKTPQMFKRRSAITDSAIRKLDSKPDLIFHVFCQSSPLWNNMDIPYVMFLDYTLALAKRNWSDWAEFRTEKEYSEWLSLEKATYQNARHLFCVGAHIKSSLIQDYGVLAEKITVTGSSANFSAVYEGNKTFGSKQLLFNGSDFKRKGGDLVLAAFHNVRKQIPDAQLVIMGKMAPINEPGIINAGHIASRQSLQELLLNIDILLAPSLCDPFPVLPMEAMNFGVPCIVSDCDGNPDIVDNEINGIILSNPTPSLLAKKIVQLLDNPATLRAFSEKAQYKIKTKLNWNQVAKVITQSLHFL